VTGKLIISHRGAEAQRPEVSLFSSFAPLRLCVRLVFVCGIGASLFTVGCGSTQFSAPNRHILAALQTAISAKNSEWLDGVARQVTEQRSKGEMTDAEFKALDAILQAAKAGQWDAAQKRIFALTEAQRPTAADLARLKEHKPSKK
jgi:hypothetical protein